jgi:uncharacterized protein YfeS
MSIFEKAVRAKLRYATDRGVVMTEDLFDISLGILNKMAMDLNKQVKASTEENFLDDVSEEDSRTKLAVLNTKKEEAKSRKQAGAKKIEREKIMGILAKKQEDALENLSEDALLAKLKELD